jgi:hypothetical protein
MTGQHLDQEAIAVAAVRQVATLMAAAAITAPKSGGQLFLAGKPAFLETMIIDDPTTRAELAGWLRARGKERRDHSRSTARLRPMRGLKRFRSAALIALGHAFVQNIRRGHYELAVDAPPHLRLAAAFTELTPAI